MPVTSVELEDSCSCRIIIRNSLYVTEENTGIVVAMLLSNRFLRSAH